MSKHYHRTPHLITFTETSSFKDTYAGPMDLVALEAHLLTPKAGPGKTVVIFMHPVGGGAYLPMVSALARAGLSVIYCNSRYRGADSALLMEKVVADLGACVRYAKEKLGFERVVLGGWSGGGSLSLMYQAEAEDPQITETPAGDPYDLVSQKLIPADGIMLLAAHVSRAITMTEWLDPSVRDENNPDDRDPALDIYHPDCPNQPPYSDAFVARFRQAQIDRNRRITAWVKDKLGDFRRRGLANEEFGFVVHRTMCDVRWLDPTQDANGRPPGTCYLGDPQTVNNGPVALARFNTLRGWLSQWSYDDSRANGPACAARITVPALVIGNTADNACTPSHTERLYQAFAPGQARRVDIAGANHYYFGQNDKLAQAVEHCRQWLEDQGLLA
ncbi:alpha/beta hydrolase fold protein [Alcanivorax hongdengensis A-11-3]|uniref:Alpha/beta hydrolase fold protein n=1 Tax=Alcanivorax hongdengensis A-11-3 TaxID=1177179 RepID=L0WEJ3_9GAMM|nr:alpha/beta fold hydrolase [Alcanivorax hongdengensis]EKF74577.1 alpha/beta hydrolase fold protein [Alcanivorax hongdengensis A-11-3]